MVEIGIASTEGGFDRTIKFTWFEYKFDTQGLSISRGRPNALLLEGKVARLSCATVLYHKTPTLLVLRLCSKGLELSHAKR